MSAYVDTSSHKSKNREGWNGIQKTFAKILTGLGSLCMLFVWIVFAESVTSMKPQTLFQLADGFGAISGGCFDSLGKPLSTVDGDIVRLKL